MTQKKIKWSLSGDEPDDLQDFKSNDEIGLPPADIYTFVVDKIQMRETQKGDERLLVWLRIDEKDKAKKKWNGYTTWEGFNLIPQSLPFLKRFLGIFGVTWQEFLNNSMQDDSVDPPEITKIGKVRFNADKKQTVRAKTKIRQYEGEDQLNIARFLSQEAELPGDTDAGDEDEDDVDNELSVSESAEDEPDEEAADDADDEDFEPWTEDELNEMDLDDLKAEAKEFDIEVKPKMRKATLVKAILEAQEAATDEEPDEDEDEDEAEEDGDDFDAMSDDELKAKGKELGASPREIRRANSHEKLVALVTELAEEPPF